MTITTQNRQDALASFARIGPDYHRGVAEALADARLFAERGDAAAAEHYLLLAEVRAGMITFEQFEANDPLGPTWVGVSSWVGAPSGSWRSWYGDGTSTTEQRDRIRAAFLSSGFAWPLQRIEVRRSAGAGSDLGIALGLLVATGVLPVTTPRPRGELGLDGSIRNTEHDLGVRTLRELVELYQPR
ncbi:MAG: hypothetical protein M1522_07555 [Actinobacteria bacterium]|nr:hypothetical protein [Actinomycetota bacterium]